MRRVEIYGARRNKPDGKLPALLAVTRPDLERAGDTYWTALFLAELSHLRMWGRPITGARWSATESGPRPEIDWNAQPPDQPDRHLSRSDLEAFRDTISDEDIGATLEREPVWEKMRKTGSPLNYVDALPPELDEEDIDDFCWTARHASM
jgi:hypothetical protein